MSPKSSIVSLVLILSIVMLINPQNFNGPMTYAQNINLVRVPGTAGDSSNPSSWVDSGIVLTGNTVSIKASGIAYYCPGCPSTPNGPSRGPDIGIPPDRCPACNLASAPVGALIAKVGDGNPVKVGSGPTSISGNGRIYFSFNDGYGDHSDNSGQYSLSVTGAPGPFFGEAHGPTRLAITARFAHIYESHTAIGCANWEIWAQIRDQNDRPTQPAQKVVDKCVDQDNTYVLYLRPTIIDESFGPKTLAIWGCNNGWTGCSSLSNTRSDIPDNPRDRRHTVQTADYSISFDVIHCPIVYPIVYNNLCSKPGYEGGYYAPGIYYTFTPWTDPEIQRWISGVAPNSDLHGHSCIFSC